MGGSGLGAIGSIVGKTDAVGVALGKGVLEGRAVGVGVAVRVAVAAGGGARIPGPGSSVEVGAGGGGPPEKAPSRIRPTPATA